MNRPNPVHSSAAEPAAEPRLMSEANKNQSNEDNSPYRVGIVSINAGALVLEHLADVPTLASTKFVSLDSRQAELPASIDVVYISIGEWIPYSIGHRVIRSLSQEQSREVTSAIPGLDIVFVIVALGEPLEVGNALIVADVLKALRIPAICIAILPFAHSKFPPLEPAIEDLHLLHQHFATFTVSQEALLRHRIKDREVGISINRSEKLSAQIMCVPHNDVPEAVERIICAVLAPEIGGTRVSYDFADLAATLDGCSGVSIGYGSSNDAEGLISSVNRAFDHPLLGRDALETVSGLLVVIESRTQGEKTRVVRDAMHMVRDVVGECCTVLFSWIVDKDLRSDYRVTLMAAHFDSSNAESGEKAGAVPTKRAPVAPPHVDAIKAELNVATNIIRSVFRLGMAINRPVSFVQRQLRVEYEKALAIVDALETAGVIAPIAGESSTFSHRRTS